MRRLADNVQYCQGIFKRLLHILPGSDKIVQIWTLNVQDCTGWIFEALGTPKISIWYIYCKITST